MRVCDIRVVDRGGGVALVGTVHSETSSETAFDLEYFVREGQRAWLDSSGDPFVAALLQLAMARGERLCVEAPVSPRLFRNLPQIMAIYKAWRPGLSAVEIVADPVRPTLAANGSALFFSGGVDSFYSLLKDGDRGADDRIAHLVLVFGFDIRVSNRVLFEQIATRVAEVARRTGKHLIVVETNVRSLSDPIATWDLYHGGPMAGVGLALGGLLNRVITASSYAYQELHPWGSHPLLDPLWSNEDVEFIHDGCEATRLEKVRRISASDLALNSLRVCWENEDTQYNCGRCEKCLRTMVALRVSGALERCRTFARPLTPHDVRRIRVGSGHSEIFLRELLLAVRASGDKEFAGAIRGAIRSSRRRARVGTFLRDHVGAWATFPKLRRALHDIRKGQGSKR